MNPVPYSMHFDASNPSLLVPFTFFGELIFEVQRLTCFCTEHEATPYCFCQSGGFFHWNWNWIYQESNIIIQR